MAKVFIETIKLLHGLLVILSFLILLVLCIPVYIFRWHLSLWVKYFGNEKLGKPVTSLANIFAVEFLPSNLKRNPKCCIGITLVVDGKVTVEELKTLISSKWLGNESQVSFYPELTQYVEPWMGFLFWKHDAMFDLNHHLNYHTIEGRDDTEVEENVDLFVEELLNKPFHPKRSPWEGYVINNYKSEKLRKECINGEMTLLFLRFHHCLGDGYSSLYAIIEGLLGTPLSNIALPSSNELRLTNLKNKFFFFLALPFRLLYDVSNVAGLVFMSKTALHASNNNNTSLQFYAKSPPIPIKRIRTIKNRLNVHFTDVLITAIAAGLAKAIDNLQDKKGETSKHSETTPFAAVLPLPGHPTKLRNHFTAAHLELPTKKDIKPLQRLKMVNLLLKRAKRGTFPLFSLFYLKAVGSMFAAMTNYLFKIQTIPVFLTNFPGPGIDMELEGRKGLMADFVTGTQGVAGVGIMLLSFRKHVRIAVTVEETVMDRNEAKKLLGFITEEFDNLYELSMECSQFLSQNDVNYV